MIYRDIGARMFSDLDILVQKENAVAARNLILNQGFKTFVNIPESQIKDYLEKENFFQLADSAKGINIDLHWEITGRYNLVPVHYPVSEQALPAATVLGKAVKTLNEGDFRRFISMSGTAAGTGFTICCAFFSSLRSGNGTNIPCRTGSYLYETDYNQPLAKKMKQDSRIILRGFVTGEPLAQLYSHAGLFVLPSFHEGLPIALLK